MFSSIILLLDSLDSVIWRKEQKVLLFFSVFLSFHCPRLALDLETETLL